MVYRSLHPDETVAAVRAARQARKDAFEAARAFTDALFGDVAPGVTMTATAFFGFDGSFSVSGFKVEGVGFTSRVPLPTGCRYDEKSKSIVPARRTDEGKALAQQMRDLTFTFPHIDGLGGIVFGFHDSIPPQDEVRHSSPCYSTGWKFHTFDRLDGTTEVYATLPIGCFDTRPRDAAPVDETRWEKVRLSAFHAAREDHEERAQVVTA